MHEGKIRFPVACDHTIYKEEIPQGCAYGHRNLLLYINHITQKGDLQVRNSQKTRKNRDYCEKMIDVE